MRGGDADTPTHWTEYGHAGKPRPQGLPGFGNGCFFTSQLPTPCTYISSSLSSVGIWNVGQNGVF